MKIKIIKQDLAKEYFAEERCFILEMTSLEIDNSLSIARARVEPGITTARHVLDRIDERYIITSGQGKMEVGDLSPTDIAAGDIVFIPAGIPQRITNTGQTDLVFYCICTPPFELSCYKNVGQD
jgi:mannose-6-phosphate isomerase-like protein (cupin superfamily)